MSESDHVFGLERRLYEVQAENERLKRNLDGAFERTMQLAEEGDNLRAKAERYRGALERIANPPVGCWWLEGPETARAALREEEQ